MKKIYLSGVIVLVLIALSFSLIQFTKAEDAQVGQNCIPNCTNRQCGDNGCGGSCGTCPNAQSCVGTMCWTQKCIDLYTLMRPALGKKCGDPLYNKVADIDKNEIVTPTDAIKVINRRTNGTYCEERLNDPTDPCCIPSCTNRQCGDNGCGGSCGTCSTEYNCINGSCVESPFNVTAFVATVKNNYSTSEIVEVTKKPALNSAKTSAVDNTQSSQNSKEIEAANFEKLSDSSKTTYKGYIIEFTDAPLIKTYLAAKGSKKSPSPADLKKVTDYKKILLANKNAVKEKIKQALGKTSLKSLGEWEGVFNGIALDITDEEAVKIEKIKGVKSMSKNFEAQPLLMDSAPLVGADLAWNLDSNGNDCRTSGRECITGKNVTVGIIDTGIDYTHPDLGGCTQAQFLAGNCPKVVGGYDFIFGTNNPTDAGYGHGTHVAGIVAGSGAGGLKGIAPDAKLYAFRVCYKNGCPESAIISGIQKSADLNNDGNFSDHLDAINLSLGGYGTPNDAMSTAVNNAVDAGVAVVVSAGNSGPNPQTIMSPAMAKNAIAVGATYKKNYENFTWTCPYANRPWETFPGCSRCDYAGHVVNCKYFGENNPRIDQITIFSSRGPTAIGTTKPDIVAPGAVICSARLNGYYPDGQHPVYYPCLDQNHVQFAGTSMASPMVTGAAALLKQAHPDWTPEEIKYALKNSAQNLGYDANTQGSGRLDIAGALRITNTPTIAKISKESLWLASPVAQINGTAKGYNFVKYSLFYGTGESPTSWTLICQSSTQVVNGRLCNFNVPSNIFEFTLKLDVANNDGSTVSDKAFYYNSNILMPGSWPKKITSPSSYGLMSSPVMADINNDGFKEIIIVPAITTSSGQGATKIYVYDKNGNILPGWPQEIERGVSATPVVGNLDSDPEKEIIIPTEAINFSGNPKGAVYAFNHNGTPVGGWPVKTDNEISSSVQTPVLQDLDNDGKDEIILLTHGANSSLGLTNGAVFFVYNQNGTIRSKWSVPLKGYALYIYRYSSFFVEDINKDGKKEIIYFNQGRIPEETDYKGRLYIWNENGTPLPGFPKVLFTHTTSDFRQMTNVALGDLDNDGEKELVIPVIEKNRTSTLYISDMNGNIKARTTVPKTMRQVAIGNVNNDSYAEIVASAWDGGLYLISHDGIILKEKIDQAANVLGADIQMYPIIIDVNNDGKREIIHSPDAKSLYILDGNLNPLPGMPKFPVFGGGMDNSPAVSDIDNDGKLELVAGASILVSDFIEIPVFKIPNSKTGGPAEWPMHQADLKHRGCYDCVNSYLKPPSKIVNSGDNSLAGTLKMVLQKKQNTSWADERVVVNAPLTLSAGQTYWLDDYWNPQSVRTVSSGRYRVYASFESSGRKAEANWEFDSTASVAKQGFFQIIIGYINNSYENTVAAISNGVQRFAERVSWFFGAILP